LLSLNDCPARRAKRARKAIGEKRETKGIREIPGRKGKRGPKATKEIVGRKARKGIRAQKERRAIRESQD